MLDKEKEIFLYPGTRIQYHGATLWNQGVLPKLDIKVKILGYEEI